MEAYDFVNSINLSLGLFVVFSECGKEPLENILFTL